jgi:hypothetical protein
MKFRSLIILLLLLLCFLPAIYINKMLQKKIQPRQSMGRMGIYLLSAFGFVFLYTFFMVWLISYLFPVAMK